MQVTVGKKNNECKLKTSKVTFKQSLMGACTNFMFKLGAIGGLKKVPQFLKSGPDTKQLVILGQSIAQKMIAKQRLSKIIWFTYRQKIKIAQDINSDVGWGCLPRVGQMVLAQAIARHLISKGEVMDQKQYERIIKPFLEDSEESASYSLSMILKYARWKHRINPGDWFNIGQLSDVLKKIQDQIPIKGTQKLKVVFFSQSVIFLNVIMERAQIFPCRCEEKNILCVVCNQKLIAQSSNNCEKDNGAKQDSEQIQLKIYEYDSGCQKVIEPIPIEDVLEPIKQEKQEPILNKNWEVYDNQNIKQWCNQQQAAQNQDQSLKVEDGISRKSSLTNQFQMENHLLLIVSVRIAEKTIDAFDYSAILNLLTLPSSLGIIGGVPSKALYLVGYEGDEVLYLDPHYVQQHVDKNNFKEQLHTFFCTQYRSLSRSALDPSMAFCFYLRTFQDLRNLLIRLEQLKESYAKQGKSFFISVMEKNTFEQQYKSQKCGGFSDSPDNVPASFEYNSLQFRDITDSF